jgi:hypothetical protein
MSKNWPTPWKAELIEKWPFGVRVVSQNGSAVFEQDAACSSTQQKTRKDNQEGVGFDVDHDRVEFRKQTAIEAVAEQDAIAHLVAAAPEMLEALKEMYDSACTNPNSTPSKGAFLKALAAIAKAEGKGAAS